MKNIKTENLVTDKFTVPKKQDTEKEIVGEATIPAGATKVKVNNTVVTDTSYIILTPRQAITVALGEIKKGKYFEIKISKALSRNLKVQWFIINKEEK